MSFISELQRRSVFRVAASYAVIGWLVLQIADVVLDPIGAPEWSMRALIVLVAIGFPIALVLAWTFELTPEGIERDRRAPDEGRPVVHGLRRYADVLVIGVLLVVIAVLLSRQERFDFEVTDTPVVAVLPFNEIGAENNVFGMGLADTLIHKLGQVQQLVVLTSSSTFEFAGTSLDLAEVGARLGASILLEGTVQRGGGALRVNARLVEARSGQQLWSDSYERAADDLFAVQDQIASEVSGALSLVLSVEQKERMAEPVTSSLTAYDAYTLGLVAFAKRGTFVADAVEYFREAVRLDPDFVLAQARLAQVLYAAPYYSPLEFRWQDVRAEAREAAEAALRLDPKLGDSHLAMYYVELAEKSYAGERSATDDELAALARTAVELSPNNARALRELARYLQDPAQQVKYLERAARLDPRSGIIRYDIAIVYAEQGEYEKATDWLLKAAATAEPYFRIGYNNIQVIWAFAAGRYDEAARWSGLMAERLGGSFWPPHFYRVLDLGAYPEAEAALNVVSALADENADFRLKAAIYKPYLSWHKGESELAARQLALAQETELNRLPGWPDLSNLSGAEWIMALAALFEIQEGHQDRALVRYQAAYPNPGKYRSNLPANIFIHPMLMAGALLKLNGREQEGRELIGDYLQQNSDSPLNGPDGTGLNRFVAYALLGDVEEARAELQMALDLSFMANTSMLTVPFFDAEYSAVMANSQVSSLVQQMLDRKAAQLRSYREQPELPPDRIPDALKSVPEMEAD